MHSNEQLFQQATTLLKRFYGYDSFRPMQYDIVEHTMLGNDSLVLMPTGGGKSICFQIPALLKDGCAIIISPLLALMKDQVDMLKTIGVPAAAVNSTQSETCNREILENVHAGKIKLLYISPERLLSEIDRWSDNMKINLIAIDEAHCISQWGHDFRPEYTKLSILKEKFSDVPIMALTATADKLTRDDIIKQLGLGTAKMFISSFDRPNLSLSVKANVNGKQKDMSLLNFIDDHQNQSGIVYCLSRATTEKVAMLLKNEGYKAECYHAGLRNDIRQSIQQRFLNDETQIICATIAFGMGIDKSNIRWVVHYNMPKNLECYYQEIGRAGRDGMPSDTLMFYSYGDVATLNHFIEDSGLTNINRDKLQRMQEYAEASVCRRRMLLSYFNERFDHDCGNCDVCKNPPLMINGTELAQMALSAIARMQEREGQMTVINVLRGIKRVDIIEKGYDKIKTFGIGANLPYVVWSKYMLQMRQLGLFEEVYSEHNRLRITAYGWDVLKGKCEIRFAKATADSWQKSNKYTTARNQLRPVSIEQRIQNELIAFRQSESKKINIPAYNILSDVTISEIVDKKPINFSDLPSITGLGDVKLVNYGRQLISIVRKQKGMNSTISGFSDEVTYYLAEKEYNIETIAKIKKVKLDTIASQIAKGIQLGKISESRYSNFISYDEYNSIITKYKNGTLSGPSWKRELSGPVLIALAIYRKKKPNSNNQIL